MASPRSLLYEVFLHAEHEEDVSHASYEGARQEDLRSAPGASVGNETASTSAGKTQTRVAMRTAVRVSVGLGLAAVRFSLKLLGTPVPGDVDDDKCHRPVLASSARGAELVVAVGKVVRTFRTEDDFQKNLGVFQIPASRRDANNSERPFPNKLGKAYFGGSSADNNTVSLVSWACDGSAFAVVTKFGEVHVVTRVGRMAHTQYRNDLPRSARRFQKIAVELLPNVEGGWDLLVVTTYCARGRGECVHVQRVFDSLKTVTETHTKNMTKNRIISSPLPGAPFAVASGAVFDFSSKTLVVVGAETSGGDTPKAGDRGFRGAAPICGAWRFANGKFTVVAVATEKDDAEKIRAEKETPKSKNALAKAVLYAQTVTRACARALGVSPRAPRCRVVVRADENGGGAEIAAVDARGQLHVWRNVRGGGLLELLTPRLGSAVSLARDAAWWSPGKLTVSFENGDVIVMDVDRHCGTGVPVSETTFETVQTLNLLRSGDRPESFETSDNRGVDLSLLCCASNDSENTDKKGEDEATQKQRRVAVLELPTPLQARNTVRWRVTSLVSKTPREALCSLLESKDWPGALGLCARHDLLNPDDVYKRQWETAAPSEIRGVLADGWSKIADRAYAVVAAISATTDSYETQRVVLEVALRETERFLEVGRQVGSQWGKPENGTNDDPSPHPSPNVTPQNSFGKETKTKNWSWWHRLRLVIFARLDRLDASHAVRIGAFSAKHWERFSRMTASDAAVESALNADPRGAIAIARAFPRCLVSGAPTSGLLDVLSAFPEHMNVGEYEPLLPWNAPWSFHDAPTSANKERAGFRVGSHKFGSTRVADLWVESETSARALLLERSGDQQYSLAALAEAAKISPDAIALAATSGATPGPDWLLHATEHVTEACGAVDENFQWQSACFSERNGCPGWALRDALRRDRDAGAVTTACVLLELASKAFPGDENLAEQARHSKTFLLATQSASLPNPGVGFSAEPVYPFAMHRKEANAWEDTSHTTLQETVSTTLLDAVDPTLQTLRVLHPTEPTPEPTTEPGTIKTRLWCSSLETFLDSTPFEKLSVVLRDGEFDFESTERVLCSAAARDLIDEPGGGEALKKWLANLARDEKFDVLAVALRWVSGGAGAGHGSLEMGEDLSVETESSEDDFFDENKQDADTQKRGANFEHWRALGDAIGVASVAIEAARATPRGGDPEANAAALLAVLDALSPSVKATQQARRARAAVNAARVLANRAVSVSIADVLDAAGETMTSDSDGPTEKVKHEKALDFLKRVASSAVASASGPNGFPASGPGVWSRALWVDLSKLQIAFENHVTPQHAAVRLLKAQLRVGDGAGETDFARRILAELWSANSGSGSSAGVVVEEKREGQTSDENNVFTQDVSVGNAVRAVWASSQRTAASDLFGALGGLVRDARAGAVHGGGVWANSHAFPKTLGGLVGGAVATVAELHSGDGGKYTQSSTAGAQSNKSGGPPAIPASVALKIVTQTCCEFLYEPGAGGGSETDDRLRRAREVLRCAPEGCQESVAHYPQGESASRLDLLEGPYESIPAGCEESVAHYPHGETLGSCRAVVATVTLLRNLGVEYSPGRLKREGVSFVGTDNGNKAPHFHLLQHVIDTSHKRAVDTTSYGRLVSDKKTQKHEKAPNGVPTRAEVWELATCLLLTQNENDTHDVELRIGQAALARNDFADALASLEVLVEARFSSAWGFVSRFVEAAGAALDELDEKGRKETCEGRTETFDRDDHEDDPVVPDRTSLKTFLAFALAAAPRDTKPALLARWQAMETRSLYAAVLGTRFRAVTDNSRRTDQEGDVTTTSDGHTETRELAARAIGARSVTHKNRDPTAYGFLRQTAGRERAAAEVAKPRSAARALAEGRDFRRLLCVFQKAAENTDTENTVSNENTESESAAAFALSYGLGTAGVCVLDHLMSPLIRDVRAAEMCVVDAGDKSDVGDKNESRTANGVCLGLLLGLKESKSVTSTIDSFSLTKTTHDAQTTLALGTRAHALRLVPAGDFEARQKALNADTNDLLVSSTNESNTGDHSKEFRESKEKLALVTNAEFVCGMLGKATHKSVSFPGKQQRVDDFVSDATKRAELIVSLARACPSVALFGYGQTDIAETQSELEKVRDELFRIAETHGVDLLQCAVSFATGLVAATDGDENTEQSLEALNASCVFLEKQFATSPERAVELLTRTTHDAVQRLSGVSTEMSGEVHAVYFGWLKKCQLGLSAACFRFAREGNLQKTRAEWEDEARRHARHADAADAAAATSLAIAAVARRSLSGSSFPRLGAVRIGAFLGKQGFDSPQGGSREIMEAFFVALAPAAAAATTSAAAAQAATSAASALARSVATAPCLPAGMDDVPSLNSAAALAAALATLRPDVGNMRGGKKRASPEQRAAAAVAQFKAINPLDVSSFARHAAFANTPHPFARFGELHELGELTDPREVTTEDRVKKGSFACEAGLSVRVLVVRAAVLRLESEVTGGNSSVDELTAAMRASYTRLLWLEAARNSRPTMSDASLASLESFVCAAETETEPETETSQTSDKTEEKSSGLETLLKQWIAAGESAGAMFALASLDATEKVQALDEGYDNEVDKTFKLNQESITRELIAAATRACQTLASEWPRHLRKENNGKASASEKAVHGIVRAVDLQERRVSTQGGTPGDHSLDDEIYARVVAARTAVFSTIRSFAGRGDVPPGARSAALEILADASDGKKRPTLPGLPDLNSRPSTNTSIDTTNVGPVTENDDVALALLAARTVAAVAALGFETTIAEATLVDGEKTKGWFRKLLTETLRSGGSTVFHGDAIGVFVGVLALWEGAPGLRWSRQKTDTDDADDTYDVSGNKSVNRKTEHTTPSGDVIGDMRVALLLRVFQALPGNDDDDESICLHAAHCALLAFVGGVDFDSHNVMTENTADKTDGWDDDGWDDDGWGTEPVVTSEEDVGSNPVQVLPLGFFLSETDAKTLTACSRNANGAAASLKTALILPYHSLWEESLLALQTEFFSRGFDTESAEVPMDDSLASLLVARLQWVVTGDTSSDSISKTFKTTLLASVVAKVATIAVGDKSRQQGGLVRMGKQSREPPAPGLWKYAVGVLCVNREYDLACSLILAITKTHPAICLSACSVPAVVVKFLAAAAKGSKRTGDGPTAHTSQQYDESERYWVLLREDVVRTCDARASQHAYQVCAEGLRQITTDLR